MYELYDLYLEDFIWPSKQLGAAACIRDMTDIS